MKRIIFFKRSFSYAVIALGIGVFVLSACCKKDDPAPAPPVVPTVKTTYAIHGVVTGLVKNDAIKDATVKLSGTATAETKTDAKGEFSISNLEKTGVYQVEVSKSGMTSSIAIVSLVGTLADVAIQMPNEPVKTTVKVTEDAVLSLPKEENTVAVEVKLQIPAGAVKQEKEIKVTQTVDAVPTAAGNKSMPLIVLNYQPDGTTFEKPCPLEIANPIGDYSFENPALEWLDPATNKWVKQTQSVDYADGAYKTSITHFSSYKISIPDVVGAVTLSKENLADMASTDNLDGKKDIKVETVPYAYKRGTIYVTSPEVAANNAGISEPKVIDFIKSSVNSQKVVAASFSTADNTYPVNVTIPVGVRMDIKGEQEFTTTTYDFKFVKAGRTVTVTVVTKTAGDVSIKTSLYTKQHNGGGN